MRKGREALMADLQEIVAHCDGLLDAGAFEDYCPNGLQVDAGVAEIRRIVSGVTASQLLIEAAREAKADLLLVHHGFFWKGEAQPLTGIKGRRIRSLLGAGISLLAYHLPLDAHAELGNNRCLGDELGFAGGAPLPGGDGLIWQAELDGEESAQSLARRIGRALGREPLHIAGAEGSVHRVAWCSGAAQSAIVQAAEAGADAFISGEISEPTVHLARELGVHYFSAGHHATERGGVTALGRHLAEKFQLEHHFIDIHNPV
jgi:dinuclear metal center YbgI/SA1388 family protein